MVESLDVDCMVLQPSGGLGIGMMEEMIEPERQAVIYFPAYDWKEKDGLVLQLYAHAQESIWR